jgi:hypothetical protein
MNPTPHHDGTGSIRVGDKDIEPDAPSHVAGVKQGNWPNASQRLKRAHGDDDEVNGGPERSTGVSPDDHGPIDPRMPRLTPA